MSNDAKTIEMTHGILVFEHKPVLKDINSIDGGFMYGYRKIRLIKNIGYVLAGGVKFGHPDLAKYHGKWVYVDASGYWAITANIGYGKSSEFILMSGVKCGFLEDLLK